MIVHRNSLAVTNAGVLIEHTGGREGRGSTFPGRVGRPSATAASFADRLSSEARQPVCDHCALMVHRDCGGWWCGEDDTADCRSNLSGHEVDGQPR